MAEQRKLRSSVWFDGTDEVALSHRVVMASVGLEVPEDGGKPIIGIADSTSDLNPCNLGLRDYIEDIKAGIFAAGGIPVVFPVMSLGEDLMKPSAMLYRNMLSMEVEEYLRSYPMDGVVLLANCDKSVPGAVMGAISTNLPTILFTGGARPVPIFQGRRIGTGTDLWRMLDDYRSKRITEKEWKEFEKCLNCGLGACNTMGTASSMAITMETLGLMIPGSSTIPANDPHRHDAALETGKTIVEMVANDLNPAKILTPAAFRNAVRVLNACGGSTNAIVHLLAVSGRIGGELTLEQFGELGKNIPVLADVEPSGTHMIQDFDKAGGLPALLSQISDLLELDTINCTNTTLGSTIKPLDEVLKVIRERSNPLKSDGAFRVVSGNIATSGAVVKVSAASPHFYRHTGRERVDDLELEVTADSVLVLSGCGAVGVPGFPEWGMIPIPKKLAMQGVTDMVRVTDARMSGTSFGTCILHVSPEAAVGGELALVEDGDLIELDILAGSINLLISETEMVKRRAQWTAPKSAHVRGWPALYQGHVLQPHEGCDLDFLRAPTVESRRFIEPVVGRS
jgi:dihydroxy-acid dehydratase